MLTNNYRIWSRILLSVFCITILSGAVWAQGNAFSFQGRLNDGTTPANGSYDLQFRLYNAATGGTQIGTTTALHPNTTLINGVFSVTLDFGAAAFNNPNSVFIEIRIRPNGSPNAYTILGPRQQLTVVPFAVRAANATNADNATRAIRADGADNALNADFATTATTATTANNALSLGGVTASNYARLNVVNSGNFITTGGLLIDGNARQFTASNGLVKASALVRVTRVCGGFPVPCTTLTPTFVYCYNSVTNVTGGNCGFSFPNVSRDGVQINFGFQVIDRFVSITSGAGATGASVASFPNTTTVSILNGFDVTSEFYIFIF